MCGLPPSALNGRSSSREGKEQSPDPDPPKSAAVAVRQGRKECLSFRSTVEAKRYLRSRTAHTLFLPPILPSRKRRRSFFGISARSGAVSSCPSGPPHLFSPVAYKVTEEKKSLLHLLVPRIAEWEKEKSRIRHAFFWVSVVWVCEKRVGKKKTWLYPKRESRKKTKAERASSVFMRCKRGEILHAHLLAPPSLGLLGGRDRGGGFRSEGRNAKTSKAFLLHVGMEFTIASFPFFVFSSPLPRQ